MDKGKHNIAYEPKLDEISLRDLILKIQEYLWLPLRYWYWLVLAALPLGIYNYYSFSKIKPTYGVRVSLFVKTRQSIKDNALTAQIFARYAAASSAVENTLGKRVSISGREDFMINHYLESFFFYKPEELPPSIPADFQFAHMQVDSFNLQERQVYNQIVRKASTPKRDFTDGFVSSSIDTKLGFITINFSSPTEELSLRFIETMQKAMQELYIRNTLYGKKEAVEHLREKADSLKYEFDESFNVLLRYRDQYAERMKDDVKKRSTRSLGRKIQRLEINTDLLKDRYLDTTEKLKSAEIDMYNATPTIHIAEKTLPQMTPYQPSVIMATAKGAIIGMALVLFLLLFRKIYQDILNERLPSPANK